MDTTAEKKHCSKQATTHHIQRHSSGKKPLPKKTRTTVNSHTAVKLPDHHQKKHAQQLTATQQ